MKFLIRLIINAVALGLTFWIVDLCWNGEVLPLLIIALIFGVVNALVRPADRDPDLSVSHPDAGPVSGDHQRHNALANHLDFPGHRFWLHLRARFLLEPDIGQHRAEHHQRRGDRFDQGRQRITPARRDVRSERPAGISDRPF